MAIQLLPEELWTEIEPLLPCHAAHPKGGHPWVEDRRCMLGILFVLRTGVPWQMIPQELGCGSGSTCWRRFHDWTIAGVWPEVHRRLLNHLGRLGEIDWSRAIIDSASVRAVFGGSTPDRTPRTGRKRAANAT
jgi:transposase